MLCDLVDTVRKFYSFYPQPWKSRAQLAGYLALEMATSPQDSERVIDFLLENRFLQEVMSCRLDRSIDRDELDLDSRLIPGPLLYEIDLVAN